MPDVFDAGCFRHVPFLHIGFLNLILKLLTPVNTLINKVLLFVISYLSYISIQISVIYIILGKLLMLPLIIALVFSRLQYCNSSL